MSPLAPFAGICSPLQVVTLFTQFIGLNSLPAISSRNFHGNFAVAPPPSVSCLRFGFWILRLVPTPTSIGLRFVFPSEYLHRLHYDLMIGPALVYPRVPHGPWTYEPHAHGRTLSSFFVSFGLGLPFVFNSGFDYLVALVCLQPSFWVPAFSVSIGTDFFCLPFS